MARSIDLNNLPVIVDTPTPTPKLGFEKYVRGISAAIMGGKPPRYTVGLYGPWGSGKSSLLASIKEHLSSWPDLPGESISSRTNPSRLAPVLVDFDAWRYADKGAIVLSVLIRIQAAVEQRSQVESMDTSLRQKLFNVSKAVKSAVESVSVSVWGISVTAGLSRSTHDSHPDVSTTLMPFDKLAEIGYALPDDQRIVVLVDDLDRCSPGGIVSTLEAIHVLTDIPGIVFVLALDYEYLTDAISKSYPTSDPDRFIEKIIQVPFHIPAPQIEDADMDHIIPNWSDIKPWVTGVDLNDLRLIMKLGLRGNPRQIKRLINTYLLFAHMDENNLGENRKRALALKILGLQVSWPRVFSEILNELSNISHRKGDYELRRLELGELDSYASWYSDDDQEEPGDEESDQLEKDDPQQENRAFSPRIHYRQESIMTPESRERLRTYLKEVMTPKTNSYDVWEIMIMAQALTQTSDHEGKEKTGSVDRLTDSLNNSDNKLKSKFYQVVKFAESIPFSNSMPRPSYYRISSEVNGHTRVIAEVRVRPTQRSVRVQVKFGRATHSVLVKSGISPEILESTRERNGQLETTYIITGQSVDAPELDEELKQILTIANENARG